MSMDTKLEVTRFGGDFKLAEADQSVFEDMLARTDRLMIASAVDGNCSAAPLHFVRDQQDVLFVCCKESRLATQIANNPSVQAVVWPCDSDVDFAAEISGYCTEVTHDADRRRSAELIRSNGRVPQRVIDDLVNGAPAKFACYRLRPRRTGITGTLAIPRIAWRDFPHNEPAHPMQALQAVGRWMRLWIHAVRAPFFTAALVPMLLGAAVARYTALRADPVAPWSWPLFLWVLVGAVLAAAGTNLINDYGDYRSGADDQNEAGGNPFTGGSRMIQMGLLAPWKVMAASVLCFAVTIGIGLHINAVLAGSPLSLSPLLVIGLLGCTLGVAYTVGPFPLSYKGLGEVAVAVGFGPVIVMGSSYVLAKANGAPWPALSSLLASAPVAIFILLVLWINQFQDAPADAATGKLNWVVRLAQAGRDQTFDFEASFTAYRWLNLCGFLLIGLLGLVGFADRGIATPFALIALLPLPIYLIAAKRGRRWVARWADPREDHRKLPFELLSVNGMSIALHLSTGLLLALAYLLPGLLTHGN